MTNAEKYKTAEERRKALMEFCRSSERQGCTNCPISSICIGQTYNPAFDWLDLEAEEEKPLPCPFCGGDEIVMSIVEDMSDGYISTPEIRCRKCGASFNLEWERTSELGSRLTNEQRVELVRKWNTRANREEAAK